MWASDMSIVNENDPNHLICLQKNKVLYMVQNVLQYWYLRLLYYLYGESEHTDYTLF